MQQELSDRVGVYDQTISADATRLKRWLNLAQQDITARQNWPFMLAHEIIQTAVDITAGTVSINAASSSLTFSSGPAVSVSEYFIKFGTDANWYKISSHAAASTSATITPVYGGTSNLIGSAYTLRKVFYATSTPFDSILDIKKTATGRFLESASARDTDVFLPLYWDTGEVYKYISSIPDSTGGVRISFLYSPSTVQNLQVRGIKKLSDLSNDGDISIIPSRWHSAMIDLGAFYAFSSVDDTRATDFFNRSEKTIMSMAETFDLDLGRQRTTRSLSTGILEGPAYVLPPQYGVNQS